MKDDSRNEIQIFLITLWTVQTYRVQDVGTIKVVLQYRARVKKGVGWPR
jgi:hypothetical protein